MAVSQSALIPRVRDLLSEFGDQTWYTQGSAASSSSVVAVTDGTDWEEGAVGEFQDDGEQFKVISVSVNNLTCFRGHAGTTGAVHAASSTIVRDPKFSYRQVNQALTSALSRLWPYVYKVTSTPITPTTTTYWYNLATTDIELLGARQEYGTTSIAVGEFHTHSMRPTNKKFIRFERELPATAAASGVGVYFPDGFYHATNTVKVRTKSILTGTSDIEDSNLLPVADALIIGALPRLLIDVQMKRLVQGVNLQQAMQISTLGAAQAGSAYEQQFQTMLFHLKLLHDSLYIVGGTH
jgi:hypothetical protein